MILIPEIVYMLCAFASTACATLLIRGYRRQRTTLLLWCSLCFIGLAINNIFLVFDVVITPETNMFGPFWRNTLSAFSGGILLYGLIWELT